MGDCLEMVGQLVVTLEKNLCIVIVQVFWNRACWLGIVILRRWSWDSMPCSGDAWWMVVIEVSQDTEFIQSVELYYRDSLEMVGSLADAGEESLHGQCSGLLRQSSLIQ